MAAAHSSRATGARSRARSSAVENDPDACRVDAQRIGRASWPRARRRHHRARRRRQVDSRECAGRRTAGRGHTVAVVAVDPSSPFTGGCRAGRSHPHGRAPGATNACSSARWHHAATRVGLSTRHRTSRRCARRRRIRTRSWSRPSVPANRMSPSPSSRGRASSFIRLDLATKFRR